ncbi:protein of unknown function [Cupriavidus taiwanensis]|uniref:Uncharacterized protein n=1 Tax=Cupriavidus taiwanensis TaxID=164546 RepID=A0A7Z7J885_9BURK|nr:protein of unknown function [Cupriavidus taiwanensis]SOZ07676.1 hypothetical protein CBM2597_A90282 [Cupriavidus taiwanensis]SPC15713.1 hypothetical protein CBM2594_A70278 [Cupriavidus taiwanensis]
MSRRRNQALKGFEWQAQQLPNWPQN